MATDVGKSQFEPWPDASVHVEWGATGAALAAARGDIVVVVDVLSFSTTLAIALERGMTPLVYAPTEIESMGGLAAAAEQLQVRPISKQRGVAPSDLSLSPASLLTAAPGQRVLFTSLNGAVVVAASQLAPSVFVVGMRNAAVGAKIVAVKLAEQKRSRATVVACGEHWSSVAPGLVGFRPCLEDWIGAGTIASALAAEGCSLSAEATAAASQAGQLDLVRSAVSARELEALGFADDVELALDVDRSDSVPTRSEADPAGRTFVAAGRP